MSVVWTTKEENAIVKRNWNAANVSDGEQRGAILLETCESRSFDVASTAPSTELDRNCAQSSYIPCAKSAMRGEVPIDDDTVNPSRKLLRGAPPALPRRSHAWQHNKYRRRYQWYVNRSALLSYRCLCCRDAVKTRSCIYLSVVIPPCSRVQGLPFSRKIQSDVVTTGTTTG